VLVTPLTWGKKDSVTMATRMASPWAASVNGRCPRDRRWVKVTGLFCAVCPVSAAPQGAATPAVSAKVEAHTKYAARLMSRVSGIRMVRASAETATSG
jgi:hypothetical protein